MLGAIVLAAGASTRMGFPKALLQAPDGRTFVARIAATLREAGLDDVIVVTGDVHAQIERALKEVEGVRLVRNPEPSRGQLSSLLTGLEAAVSPALDALLVTLVDVPLVRASTVRAVIDAWRTAGAPIVRPAVGDRHGHPVMFDRRVFDELRQAPPGAGAKVVVRAHAADVCDVQVDDEGCLRDVDTPADYAALAAGE